MIGGIRMHGEHKRSAFPGILLIALGVFFILVKLDILDWRVDHLWTYLIMIVGAAFWVRFLFEKEKPGVLMPGTILLTIGLVFNYASRNGWHMMEHLWPFFILAPAFGFYALFIFGERDKHLLIPAGIMTVIGVIFLLQSYDRVIKTIWPLVIIIVGAFLLYRGLSSGSRGHEDDDF